MNTADRFSSLGLITSYIRFWIPSDDKDICVIILISAQPCCRTTINTVTMLRPPPLGRLSPSPKETQVSDATENSPLPHGVTNTIIHVVLSRTVVIEALPFPFPLPFADALLSHPAVSTVAPIGLSAGLLIVRFRSINLAANTPRSSPNLRTKADACLIGQPLLLYFRRASLSLYSVQPPLPGMLVLCWSLVLQ